MVAALRLAPSLGAEALPGRDSVKQSSKLKLVTSASSPIGTGEARRSSRRQLLAVAEKVIDLHFSSARHRCLQCSSESEFLSAIVSPGVLPGRDSDQHETGGGGGRLSGDGGPHGAHSGDSPG